MRRLVSTLCAAIMSLTMGGATATLAAPIQPMQVAPVESAGDAQQVQYRWRHGGGRHYGPGNGGYAGRYFNGPGRHYGGGRHYAGRGWYPRHGHRYYRHRGNDFGPIVGGLVAGAIIGGLANQAYAAPRYSSRRYYATGDAHTDWCRNRYRSYDIGSDTYQPYHGPRRYCNSPYR